MHLQVNGGDHFVFMLIPGGTLDMVRQNPTNDPDTGAYAFFSLDRLNPDGIPHTVSYAHKTDGSVEFGFEDLLDGGDNDFDDLVYRVTGLDPVPGLVVTKTADDPTSAAGESNGYTVTIANGSGLDVPLESISDSLPAGFVYKPGSTSGAVPAEPAVSGGGRELRWNAPGIVPAGGSLRLHFDVTVANAAGEYLNEATAAAGGFAVEPSGPTAKVTVEVAPVDPTVTPVNDPPVAEVKRSTDLVLGCSDRRVVLEDVFIEGKKVRLLGVAAREFAGRKVRVVFGATGKTVARGHSRRRRPFHGHRSAAGEEATQLQQGALCRKGRLRGLARAQARAADARDKGRRSRQQSHDRREGHRTAGDQVERSHHHPPAHRCLQEGRDGQNVRAGQERLVLGHRQRPGGTEGSRLSPLHASA